MTASLASTLEPVLVDLLKPGHPLRALVDALPLLVSYVDRNQRYRFNNLTYEVWFGHVRGDIYGKYVRDVLGETAYDIIRPNIERALAGIRASHRSLPTDPVVLAWFAQHTCRTAVATA
jgi:hypothetical protein